MTEETQEPEALETTDDSMSTSEGESAETPDLKPPRKKADPLVQALILTIFTIVVLTLVTVAYALLTGVFGTGAPRTHNEQRVMSTAAKVEAGSTDRLDWMAYILALTDDGQYRKAQEWIDKGKETLEDQEISADMLYMQADLYAAQGEYDEALETADEALKTIKDAYDAALAEYEQTGGMIGKAAAFGISKNYGELLLLKAEIYEDREEWDLALAAYDEYLAENQTAATVFTMRGEVKEELGDTAGAEADYRRTLEFIADDPNALAGLERIGASE